MDANYQNEAEYQNVEFCTQKERSTFARTGRRCFLICVLLVLCFLLIFVFLGILLGKVLKLSSEMSEFQEKIKDSFSCGSRCREWEHFDCRCYFFSVETATWHRARSQCQVMNSDLVVIHDEAEQNFIQSRTRKQQFWIGLHDQHTEGEWKWVDGTDYRTSYKNWKQGEPNNYQNRNEDCGQVLINGEWNDYTCNSDSYFICEKPLPSKPAGSQKGT